MINGTLLDVATLFPHIVKNISKFPIKDFKNQVISQADLQKIFQKAAIVFHVSVTDLFEAFVSQLPIPPTEAEQLAFLAQGAQANPGTFYVGAELNNRVLWLIARSDDCPDKLKSALSAALPLIAV